MWDIYLTHLQDPLARKSSTTTRVATTIVQCASPNAAVVDELQRPYCRSPPPSPVPPPEDYLSFEMIGIHPPAAPLPDPIRKAKRVLTGEQSPFNDGTTSCYGSDDEASDDSERHYLRSARSLTNICRARTKDLNLQAQFAHSPANPVWFEEDFEALTENVEGDVLGEARLKVEVVEGKRSRRKKKKRECRSGSLHRWINGRSGAF